MLIILKNFSKHFGFLFRNQRPNDGNLKVERAGRSRPSRKRRDKKADQESVVMNDYNVDSSPTDQRNAGTKTICCLLFK